MNYKWNLTDLGSVPKNGHKVFSCFSCGGGSTMGYKRAGYDVIGCVEIDRQMMDIYKKNHHPRFPFLMDIREFNAIPDAGLPPELFALDILDGSPPCSTFSMSGSREKDWGKARKFREGQKAQRLDMLFMDFIDTAARLKPKVIVAENVTGIIKGNAKGYIVEILNGFRDAGYDVQMFKLNAATMGVPQNRERVFFVARQKALDLPNLTLTFNEPPILFGDVRSEKGIPLSEKSKYKALLERRRPGDKSIADIYKRVHGRVSGFNNSIAADNMVASTVTSNGMRFRMCDGHRLTKHDYLMVSTFPQDYDFGGMEVQYVCGMCVPPVMMEKIAAEIYRQWLCV